jgi:hypothetical protein
MRELLNAVSQRIAQPLNNFYVYGDLKTIELMVSHQIWGQLWTDVNNSGDNYFVVVGLDLPLLKEAAYEVRYTTRRVNIGKPITVGNVAGIAVFKDGIKIAETEISGIVDCNIPFLERGPYPQNWD